ncbi:hypothetical protein D1224_13785 [Henriciella barbarensis]|uniref:1-deoxy-D-xylulose-5-phosphate synthase n=1 Tax=Henriciella barbarensis TaxID=86342 RepID=A0A399QRB0_9PROT|nr:hypothetical protein [Henriciella barbarensis]RIJ21380.1 hypothetical protein D1224_13785 [Henriciella barbarensis]
MTERRPNLRERIMHVELKSGFADNGPAWIDRVRFSKSGRSAYFQGRELLNIGGSGIRGNYRDVETREEFWVSGVKKNRADRHWAGGGPVEINPAIRVEYERLIEAK